MTNVNTIRLLIAATAAVFLGFGAVGATQEWSGSVTVSDDVADDITLDGTVEVTVASGSTFTLSGTISDKSGTAGKITLTRGVLSIHVFHRALSGATRRQEFWECAALLLPQGSRASMARQMGT